VVLVTMAGEAGDPNIATVTTDREDYAPGDSVIVTGTGWEPGETVDLLFHEEVDPPIHPDKILIAVADADGHIFNQQYEIDEDDVDVRFILTATGRTSGRTAQTTFTDGNKTTFSSTAGGAEVTDFGTIGTDQCVPAFVQARQGGNPDNESGTVTLSSTPTGVVFFSGGTCTSPAITTILFTNEAAKAISFKFATAGSFVLKGDGPWSNNSNDASATLTVKQAQTITFTSTEPSAAVVGGPTYTAAATASSGLTVSFSSLTPGVCTSSGVNGATIAPIAVGTCTVAANQAGNATFNAAPQATQSFSVSAKAPQTISFTSTAPVGAVHGGTYAVSATATSGLAVVFSSLTLPVCTVAANTVSFVGAGTCTVAANQPGNASFLAAPQVTQGFAIGQASQTISFAALADKAYGDANFTVSATASSGLTVSLAASGDCSVLGTTVHLTGNGSCTITASQAGNTNYTAAADVPQTFAINKASVAPHITVLPREYDGSTTATIASRSLSGVVGTDDVSLDGGTAAFADKDAGNGKTVTGTGFTLTGTDAGKYQLAPTTATTMANITRRAITVTASTDNRTYDGTTSSSVAPAITSGSLASGDVAAFIQTYDTKRVGAAKTLTPAGTVTDGNSGNNYTVTFATSNTGVITTRPLTVGATGTPKTYDGNTDATVNLSDDRISGDALLLSYSTASFANKNAGTAKSIAVSGISVTGADADNYTFNTTTTATANINRRPISVSAVTDDRVYNGTTNSAGVPTITTGTLVAGETPDFTQAYDTKHVGTGKTLTAAGTVDDGNSGNNYDVTFVDNTTGVIKVRPITVTAATASKTYDRTISSTGTPSVTTGSLATGDVGTFTQTYDTRHVGTGKTLTAAGTVNDGNSGNNYDVTFVANTAGVILPKSLTGTITAEGKVYDGATNATIVSRVLAGVIDPDDVSYVGGTATFDTKHAGTNKLVEAIGLSLSGVDAGNYLVNTTATATATISRRPITVTAVADTKMYDGLTSSGGTPAITTGSLPVGDTQGFSQTFDTKDVGTSKTLTPAGTVNDGNSGGNYDVTFVANHAGKITPRALTVTATGIPKVYDGTLAATVTLSDDRVTGDVLSLGYAGASFADENVGTAKPVSVTGITVTGTDAGNYTFNTTASAAADITRRPLAVTAAATDKYYDGNTTASVTLSATPLAGDVVTLSFASANFDNASVGSNKTVTVAGITLGGADGGNYEANPPTHTTTASASILAWTLAGFYQPVDMSTGGLVLNSIKGGQTVPLKFDVFVGGVERTDVASVKSFVQAQVSCPSAPILDEVEIVSTGGTVLRYDGSGGQFIQNWQTPRTAGTCYRVTMTTQDNSALVAYFRTK
jgi:hypothetical protein